MKLNSECVRDVLLSIEKIARLDNSYNMVHIPIKTIFADLSAGYRPNEVFYTIRKLNEGGYVEILNESKLPQFVDISEYYVIDITYKGHQYLNSVRDNNIWSKIKPVVGNMALGIIQATAEKFILSSLNFQNF